MGSPSRRLPTPAGPTIAYPRSITTTAPAIARRDRDRRGGQTGRSGA
jgi:hypothetical protein